MAKRVLLQARQWYVFDFGEDVGERAVERRGNIEDRFGIKALLAALEPGDVGLVDMDPVGELHLGKLALLATAPDRGSQASPEGVIGHPEIVRKTRAQAKGGKRIVRLTY